MSNSLSQGWEEKRLGDILTLKYGKDHKKLGDGNIPVYGSGGVMRYVNEFLYDEESILIPRKGTLSNLFYITEPFWTVDTIFWSKINDKLINGRFLFYYLKKMNLSNLNEGSAVPSLTTKVLNEVKIFFPRCKSEQKRIADILSAFDDKIELNNQINKTLEDMATALFKEWFENFNFPNDEGKAYKENGGKFKSSELGEIPIDWNILNLSKITSKIGDGLHGTPNYSEDGEYFFINGNNLVNGVVEIDKKTKRASFQEFEKYKKKLDNNTIFLSINGTLGNIAFYKKEKIFLSKSVCYINPIDEYYKFFIACLFKSSYFKQYLFNYSNGTTIKNLSLKAIRELSFSINEGICKKFSNIIKPIFEQIQQNQQQNQTLKKQRDTLLPKLMTGKIRV